MSLCEWLETCGTCHMTWKLNFGQRCAQSDLDTPVNLLVESTKCGFHEFVFNLYIPECYPFCFPHVFIYLFFIFSVSSP